jgi:hypothetical protein
MRRRGDPGGILMYYEAVQNLKLTVHRYVTGPYCVFQSQF